LVLVSFLTTLGYLGVFALVFVLNVIPAFVPPSWAVLSLIYLLYPQYFSPLPLALIGCIASTLGRFILSYIGTASRAIMGETRKESLTDLRKTIESNKAGGFLLSLAVALSPLPSNMYFIMIGVMKYQVIEVFLGFTLGRFISYLLLVSLVKVAAHSFRQLFRNEFYAVTIIDLIALASVFILAIIDWHKLIEERRIVILWPTIRRRKVKNLK
jgi:membrane protein YqaA with SNARE-associated domain